MVFDVIIDHSLIVPGFSHKAGRDLTRHVDIVVLNVENYVSRQEADNHPSCET